MVPLVSIIVPIYNMEKYLPKCLDSIQNQTLRDIEIILINDGSTDTSGKIADDYALKDSRIKVIHKDNGGVSSARNSGMVIATGQYIGFVDPDDWISYEMYEKLYAAAEIEELDIVICHNYNHFIEKGYYELDTFNIIDNTLANIRRNSLNDQYFSAVWNMIFKRSLIKEINHKFAEHLTVWEDGCFVLKAFYATNNIKYIEEAYYHYRKPERKQKYIHNLFESLLYLQDIRELCVRKWGNEVFNDFESIEGLFCKRVVLCLEQEMNLNMSKNGLSNIEKIIQHPLTKKSFMILKKNKNWPKQIGWHAFVLLQLSLFKNRYLIILTNTIFNYLRRIKKAHNATLERKAKRSTKKSNLEGQKR
ncbi:MAG: glycosyltransferase [Neobacillus sp.]